MIPRAFYQPVLICAAVFLSPLLFVRARRRARGASATAQLRILITPQLTRIGDLVCSTPVFRALKRAYPGAYLAVLATNKNAAVLQNNPHIDEVILYRRVGGVFKLPHLLRARRFDWSIDLTGNAFSAAFALLALIPRRVRPTYNGRPLLLRLADCFATDLFHYEHHTFLPKFYLRLLQPLGIHAEDARPEVFVSPAERAAVAAFLGTRGVASDALLVGMSITAGNKIKEWGDEHFAELAKLILSAHPHTLLLIGGPADASRIDALIALLPESVRGRVVSATGLPLHELPALMERLVLYVGVDTGPIYIAHALRIPLIDIVGPVDASEQPPQDERSVCILPPDVPPTSFVFKSRGNPALTRKALAATSVSNVFGAVEKLLSH
ncbi:MAG: glycosyl transferase, family 9 [Parcubacteria group bacterium Gr01-1014_72]|nr:MAG: glycosyl transferase, family 9 [Parcubacteria group bacterium Gr01-1014_72]